MSRAPDQGKIIFALEIVLAFAFVAFALRWTDATISNLQSGDIWANDFFTFWSAAKFAISQQILQIYDNAALHQFQLDLGDHPMVHRPFVHPPFFLFFIMPLGFLNYQTAFVGWSAGTFAAYFLICRCREVTWTSAFLALFAPATIVAFAFGQTGLLSAALIWGGFQRITRQPALAGIFFGVASFKPQLGILIPVALVSARLWRTFAAACGTIAVLVLASSVAFGWSLWPSWGEKLVSHANWVANVKDRYNPTISASLTFIGIDLAAARIVQLAVAAGVAVVVWVCFRRGVTALAVAALLAGTFLATPYAVVYDLPMLTSAIVVLLAERSRTETNPTLVEALILALALVLPIIILETWRLSALKSLPLLLLFGLIVRKIFHSRSVKPEVRPSLY